MQLSTIAATALVTALAAPGAALAQQASPARLRPDAPIQTQSRPAARRPPAPQPPRGLRASFAVEHTTMAASSTFTAVTGSSGVLGWGAGGELTNVWKRAFVRVSLSVLSKEGSRGFVLVDGFQPTFVPVDLRLRYLEIGGGWRGQFRTRPRLSWYVSGGMLFGTLGQTSPFAQTIENNSATSAGLALTAGLEYAVRRPIVAGIEGQYRTVGDVLGKAGVSAGFGETNFGGFALRGLVGWRFGK